MENRKEKQTETEGLLDRLLNDADAEHSERASYFQELDKGAIIEILNKLQMIIFPKHFRTESYRAYTEKNYLNVLLEEVLYYLSRQVAVILKYENRYDEQNSSALKREARRLVLLFLDELPKIRSLIWKDIEATYEGDPAAYNTDEIIFCYPGLYAILVHRIAHELFRLSIPLIPRIMSEHAHSITGIDIHPGATIGEYFFIDHGTGIVIGETTVIGEHVKVYQGVTLGALSTRGGQALKSVRRHPQIGDNVTIYSGASILGGDTIIGRDAVIGGNVFITSSVPAGARVNVKTQELSVRYPQGKEN